MRVARLVLALSIVFFLSLSLAAQQTATTNSQALLFLQRSFSALGATPTLTDVTLSGTARRIAGSDDDTGTAVFKALASGAARTDLTLSSGQRSEVQNLSATSPAGTWYGPDRVSHAISYHNLLTEPAWFFPAFAITRRLSTSGYVPTYVGHETHNGQVVEHISVSQTSLASSTKDASFFQHLTQVDFFLDSTTLLPSAIAFNIHPDNNALLDIPVEIRFSDYRAVSGAQIPFHVQKFLNNSLTLDFRAESVAFNTGLTAAQFTVQ
jgi:hypothetical protein